MVEDGAALKTRAAEVATLTANHAPLTLNATKQALARLTHRLSREEGQDLIVQCYMSQDLRRRARRFLEQASAAWRGE